MPSSLDRAIEIMDRLRSPGGCPWDAEQTHESLTRYLLEETYEVIEAIESADVDLLREELGDLLLQVLFHARLAEELPPGQAFGIEDVAADLADKLVRRHPHVFGDAGGETAADGDAVATDPDTLNEVWERQKIVEKRRTSVVEGVPLNQPALALAAKLVARGRRAGLLHEHSALLSPQVTHDGSPASSSADEIGAELLAVVEAAVSSGIDPEGALRRATRELRDQLIAAENDLERPNLNGA